MIDKDKKYYTLCQNDEKQEIVYGTYDEIQKSNNENRWTSYGPYYETIDELYKKLGILNERCKICGNLVETHYYEPTRTQLITKNYCFSCNLWDERLKNINNKNVYIVNGSYYTDGGFKETTSKSSLGFGGSVFKIKRLNSDEVIVTNNLWHGGEIPKCFREKYLDNAIFVK